MTAPSALASLEYSAETAFAEDSSTFSTHRIPVRDAIDPSGLTWSKEATGHVTQYMTGGSGYVLMGQAGSFTTKLDMTGHGTTTAGSPTISAVETLIGYVFGNATLSASASTTASGGTAAAITTVASGTFAAGSLFRAGALGDGDGEGQMYRVGSHSGTTLTPANELAGAPVNGAVIFPAVNLYLHETPFGSGLTASVPGLRFRFLSSNLQYACHGCYPTAVALSGLAPGQRPTIDITWAVSRWTAVSATFPSAVSTTTNLPAPNAAGSLFVNDVGTATRAVRSYRDLSVEITLGMAPIMGPGGVSAYQSVIGCVRMPTQVKWSWVEDADATTASPVLQGWATSDTKRVHIMATLSPTVGKQVGLYSPNVCVSEVPVQFNDGGINRVRFTGMAETGQTTTTNLTASSLVMGWA
jgi:hypothetical protein